MHWIHVKEPHVVKINPESLTIACLVNKIVVLAQKNVRISLLNLGTKTNL